MASAYGIDIGADAIKAVRLRRGGGAWRVEAALRVPLDRLRQRGVDVEDENDLAAALRNELEAVGLRPRSATLGVSRDTILRYSKVPPVPPWRLALIMQVEIEDIIEKRGEEVAADYRLLLIPRSATDEFTVMVGMADSAPLSWRLAALGNARIGVAAVCPTSLAFYNTVRTSAELPDPGTALALDVGHGATQLVLIRDGELIFARSAPIGMEAFYERVQERLRVDPAEARRLSAERGDANRADDPVSAALGEAAGTLYGAVRSTLQFASTQTRLADLQPKKIILAGGGSALRGLADYLAASLDAPVELLEPLGGVPTEDGAPAGVYAAALGLALGALDRSAATLDLLPRRYKQRNVFLARTRYLVAAGVLVLLAVALSFVQATLTWSRKADRHAGLSRRRDDILARRRSHETIERANREGEALAATLAERAAPAAAFARLVTLLQRAPRNVAVTSVEFPGTGSDPGVGALSATVRGEVDNANDDGLDVVDRLAADLAAQEGIAEARPDGGSAVADPQAGVVRFRLDVVFD